MAKRFRDTAIWDRAWYRALTPKMKCAINFLFDRCDHAGVWTGDFEAMSFFVGESVTEEEVTASMGDKIRKLPNGDFFLTQFVGFQYGELRDNNSAHLSVIKRLESLGISVSVQSGYSDRPSAILSRLSAKKKQAVMAADYFTCTYCGERGTEESLRVDHIVPRSKGGGNDDANLTTACVSCNAKKGDMGADAFIERHGLSSTLSASLKTKLIAADNSLSAPNKPLLGAMDKEKDKDKDKEKVSGEEGSGEKGAAPPLEVATLTCVAEWGASLRHHGLTRDPRLDEVDIARAIRQWGFERVLNALAGFRAEADGNGYNAKANCYVGRFWNKKNPGAFERLETNGQGIRDGTIKPGGARSGPKQTDLMELGRQMGVTS